jgi:hypothetical protein
MLQFPLNMYVPKVKCDTFSYLAKYNQESVPSKKNEGYT